MNIAFTIPTRTKFNRKTGMIPVSTTGAQSCPHSCPLSRGGCYAKQQPLRGHWDAVTNGERGTDVKTFAARIRALPEGQLWRHNQAGDLPGVGESIDGNALRQIVRANVGRRGFTYTHKPMTRENRRKVARANAEGFTVNLSANHLAHADMLADMKVGPVVVVLPAEQMTNIKTPAGRTVVVCPAMTHEGVTCASCGLCQRADRPSIVGFPAHGHNTKKAASRIANGEISLLEGV